MKRGKIIDNTRASRQERPKKTFVLLVVGVLLAAVVGTGVVTNLVHSALKTESRKRLTIDASETMNRLDVRLRGVVGGLGAAEGFFAGSENVTRAEFYEFIAVSRIREAYPGFSTFSYVERVSDEEKAAYLEKVRDDRSVRTDGYPDFDIMPEGDRDEYWPITYVDPETTAGSLLGVDQFADASRRENLERARDTGETSVTSAILLRPRNRLGVIMATALYASRESKTETMEAPRASFTGAITVAMYFDEFFEEVFTVAPFMMQGVNVEIFEGGSALAERPFYASAFPTQRPWVDTTFYPQVRHEETYEIGGRVWTLVFTGEPGYGLSQAEAFAPLEVFLLGLLVVGIIVLLFFLIRGVEAGASLKRQNELLKQRQDVIRTLSHQLRTPLTGMRWGIETLGAAVRKKDREELMRETVGKVEDLNQVVERLLYHLETASGRAVLAVKEASLAGVLKKAVNGLKQKAERRGVTLTVDIRDDISFPVDDEKLSEAFSYLIDNAIVYTKMGGNISVVLAVEGAVAEVRVKDSGIGIPESEQDAVFKEIFRAENASETKNVGSGASLLIAKSLIEDHGGSLSFTSAKGAGSVFTVSFLTDGKGA